jgi:hypothetical protein
MIFDTLSHWGVPIEHWHSGKRWSVVSSDSFDRSIVSCRNQPVLVVGIGMTCSVLGLTPAQLNALRAAPSLASDLGLVVNEHRWQALLNDVLEHAPADRRAELQARQAHFEQSPAGREAAEREGEAHRAIAGLGALESALSLVPSCRLLHFVSVGDVSAVGSLADLLLSGESMGGCGSARLHGEAQTRELSRLLDAQGREWLLCASGTPEWEFNDGRDLHEEVDCHFPRLRDYVRAMAAKGNGLVVLVG